MISRDGKADTVVAGKIEKTETFSKIDAGCLPGSQNTTGMTGSDMGLTLAGNYLVGVGVVCRIDRAESRIRLLSDFKSRLPENAFAAAYVGEHAGRVYFLLNGRPLEGAGYAQVVSIHTQTQAVEVRAALAELPGFSGAMLRVGGVFWFSLWEGTNTTYEVSTQTLLAALATGAVKEFASLAVAKQSGFEGISSFALANESEFLFYNNRYQSFVLDRKTGATKPVAPTCEPLMGEKATWWVLCGSRTLERALR